MRTEKHQCSVLDSIVDECEIVRDFQHSTIAGGYYVTRRGQFVCLTAIE